MSKWKDSLNEPVSGEHERKVLDGARALLKQNAELAAADASQPRRWSWLYLAVPTLALGALTVILVPRLASPPKGGTVARNEPLSPELELALNYDLIRDVHEIENLELLQKLGDPKRWTEKKPKHGKS